MAGWGISPKASAKEKIKAEYADTLHGYNSCGVIDYKHYSELFDLGMELLDEMHEQGQKDLKGMEKAGKLVEVVRCKDCDNYDTYGCSEGAGWCEAFEIGRFDNGYCDNAKLKELEGTEE